MAETKRDRVAAELRALVQRRHVGERLPALTELVTQYGASVNTVRNALLKLDEEGLVRTEHGVGSYVLAAPAVPTLPAVIERHAAQRLSKAARDADSAGHHAELDAQGLPGGVDVRVYFERATSAIAEALGVAPGEEVVVRDRVMSIGGTPTQLATSRLPRSITQGTRIEEIDTGPGGIHARLDELGFTLAWPTERVRLHEATEPEAKLLGLSAQDATLRITRTQPDTSGRVLELNTMTLVNRYELVYPVPTK